MHGNCQRPCPELLPGARCSACLPAARSFACAGERALAAADAPAPAAAATRANGEPAAAAAFFGAAVVLRAAAATTAADGSPRGRPRPCSYADAGDALSGWALSVLPGNSGDIVAVLTAAAAGALPLPIASRGMVISSDVISAASRRAPGFCGAGLFWFRVASLGVGLSLSLIF